jgi:arsenate reductase-like glutaredoxin family protein
MEELAESEISEESSEENDEKKISILVNMNSNKSKDAKYHTHRFHNDFNMHDCEEDEPNAITVNEGIKNIEKTEEVVLQNRKTVLRINITANVNNPDSDSSSNHVKLSKKQRSKVYNKNKSQINLGANLRKKSNISVTDEGFVDEKKFYMNKEKFHIYSVCQWAGSADKFASNQRKYDFQLKEFDLSSNNSNNEALQKFTEMIERPKTIRLHNDSVKKYENVITFI